MPFADNTQSLFTDVPHDILREIFHQCLPEDRLDEPQPNTKIAPMLLCHVCACWRTVALANASLWTHLHIRLPIRWDNEGNLFVRDSEALKRDIEFMKWWRTNHGLMAPFLRINIHRISWRDSTYDVQESNLDYQAADFLFDYVASAQYLDIGIFYTHLIRQAWVQRGLHIMIPKLHTLVSDSARFRSPTTYGPVHYRDAYPLGLELPSQIPPTVRRLAIHYPELHEHSTKNLHNWSTLTHLSLNQISLHPGIWFSILCELKDLEWGNFVISVSTDTVAFSTPPKISLRSLTTLTLCCNTKSGSPSLWG